MKTTNMVSFFLGCLFCCVIALTLMNCQMNPGTASQALVTEKQECLLKHFVHMTEEAYPMTVAIDVPESGMQPLVDSVALFLNEALYAFFDNGENRVPFEKVFTKDVKQLLEHYRSAYSPFILSDSTEEHDFASDCLEVDLVAQTERYVTFQVNSVFYGEGVEIASEWVTFAKSDGHRLREVISEYDMLRFYREHPEQRSDDIWENLLNHCYEDDSLYDIVCSVGLLDDSLAHQYVYAAGIFEDVKYPLNSIAPYLSKEAQELIR